MSWRSEDHIDREHFKYGHSTRCNDSSGAAPPIALFMDSSYLHTTAQTVNTQEKKQEIDPEDAKCETTLDLDDIRFIFENQAVPYAPGLLQQHSHSSIDPATRPIASRSVGAQHTATYTTSVLIHDTDNQSTCGQGSDASYSDRSENNENKITDAMAASHDAASFYSAPVADDDFNYISCQFQGLWFDPQLNPARIEEDLFESTLL